MSGPAQRIIRLTQCAICDRGRRQVPALVEINKRCVCSECVATAAEALVDHYHPINPFAPPPVEQPAPGAA